MTTSQRPDSGTQPYATQLPYVPPQAPPPGVPYQQQYPPLQQPIQRKRLWPQVVGGFAALIVGLGVLAVVTDGNTPQTPASVASPTTANATPGYDRTDQTLDQMQRDLDRRRSALAQAPAVPAVPSGPVTTVSDGTYQVGTDMVAGRYKTTGPDGSSYRRSCYVERSDDDSGELGSIIANDNVEGPSSVTVKAGEFAKFSGPCTWTKQ